MKKILFLLTLACIARLVHAQTPQVKPKTKTPAVKVDTIKKQDNMPIVKPKDNSPMPVVTPPDNSRMPIVNPDKKDTIINRRKQPRK